MSVAQIAPYGSWRSPISADLIASATIALGQIALDGCDLYWVELRPTEDGRSVIVRRTPDGRTSDVTPAGFNVRTRVHEYGGGAFTVADGTVYFSHFGDQRLYRQDAGAAPHPISPDGPFRYADGRIDAHRGRLICVREDHSVADHEAVTTIVSVDVSGNTPVRVLLSGNDFYGAPRFSPDGRSLAWLTWNHPNMPWDGTELWSAEIQADGALGRARYIAGGIDESVLQPEWAPDGRLYFLSDRSGWWNLYRWHDGRVEPLCPMSAEFGRPPWQFDTSAYAFESATRLVCTYAQSGRWHLATLDTNALTLKAIESPYAEIANVRAAPGTVVCCGGAPTAAFALLQLDLDAGRWTVVRRSSAVHVDAGYVSVPDAIEFPTTGGLTAHALFYAPRNRDCVAPPGERPPLLVIGHGGPTAATSTALSLGIQYWTSRGLAVLDVDYRGSTGYGRDYRRRLDGEWGVADVDDCVNGARYLVDRGLVDADRLAIRGGSAGGFTTLCALTFRDVFRAGASYYGIGDLEALARDTHKFEARYLDRLVGPYPAQRERYRARSPIHFVDRLACPVIFFQGLDDRVVPPNQAEQMVAALRAKHVPVAYLPFAGEQHGFRRAETITRAREAELVFYAQVFRFELPEPLDPVAIE